LPTQKSLATFHSPQTLTRRCFANTVFQNNQIPVLNTPTFGQVFKRYVKTMRELLSLIFILFLNGCSSFIEPCSRLNKREFVYHESFGNRFPVGINFYSPSPSKRNKEGFAIVAYDISEDGLAENITVLAAEPKGAFERASIEALECSSWQPAERDGKQVAVRKMVDFHVFCLDDNSSASHEVCTSEEAAQRIKNLHYDRIHDL